MVNPVPAGPYLIIGASAGIGAALARRLARHGDEVVVAGRREAPLQALREENPDCAERIHPRVMDVTDFEGLREAIAAVERGVGPIRVCIMNAGEYEPVGADDLDPALFERIHRVNYLGAVNTVAAMWPLMRERRSGQILLTGSLSAYRGLPKAAAYGSSKAALLSLAESLRPELGRAGVQLRVINPGFVKTRLTAKNTFHMPQLMSPEEAAEAIFKGLGRPGFEIAFPKRLTYTLKVLRLLPYRLYFRITGRMVS